MDECIAELPKLLIWLKNTYKQKKKTNNRRGRAGAESINGKREKEGADLLILECDFSCDQGITTNLYKK